MWVCIWRCNQCYIRMLSLQRSNRRIEIKTSFSSWTLNWSPTFWRWHLNWDATSANFQICTTLLFAYKTFYQFMITSLPPSTPSQIYICLINQSINQFHLRYKYSKTWLYYILEFHAFCFVFCFCFFVVSPFFHFSKNLFIMLYIVFYYCWRMYYCNYLLCGEDPCKLL